MTCRTRSTWLTFCVLVSLALAGCGEAEDRAPPFERALAALEAEDGFGAELALTEMLAAGTPREQLAAYMGEAELLQGNHVDARRWLEDAAFAEDNAGRGFHALGRLEMREGNLPEAGAAFDRALAIDPRNPRLWVDIGRLRYRGGEQLGAIEAAEQAVAYDPADWQALMFRGQIARDAQGAQRALAWFERALEAAPDQTEVLAEYAATLGEAGRPRAMLAAVRQLAERDPGHWRVYHLQAVLAARAGQYDLARRLLANSGEANKQAPAGLLLSGIIDLQSGNYASAAQLLDRLHRHRPENRRARDLLVRALVLAGNHRELLHRFADVASRDDASPYLRLVVARSHEALGQREEAAALLDTVWQGDSKGLRPIAPSGVFAEALPREVRDGREAVLVTRAQLATGDVSGAVQTAEEFRRQFPGSADAHSLAGDALLAAGQAQPAIARYKRAASVRRSWSLTRRWVEALKQSGRNEEALELLGQFAAGHPGASDAVVLLAQMRMDQGELGRAAQLLDHAMRLGGEGNPRLLAMRALVARQQGELAAARGWAQRAVALAPTQPDAVAVLAASTQGTMRAAMLAKLSRLSD